MANKDKPYMDYWQHSTILFEDDIMQILIAKVGVEGYLVYCYLMEKINRLVKKDYVFETESINKVDFSKKVIVVTAHRRENLGEGLNNICMALNFIANKYQDEVEIIYPMHLNPVVRETANKHLGNIKNVHLIDPVDVCELHNLMNKSYMIMTDSGGLQEEAPSLGKPVLVLRNETERPEAVKAGTVKIAGVNKDEIIKMAEDLLESKESYEKMAKAVNPYGDGFASKRICDAIIEKYYGKE